MTASQRTTLTATLLLLICLLLSGCSLLEGEAEATPVEQTATAPSVPDAETAESAAVIDPTIEPEPTVAPTATPVAATITVAGQIIAEDNVLTIESVTLPEAGWLAVFSVPDAGDGELLGNLLLDTGTHEDVAVEIESENATSRLLVRLYSDKGEPGEMEIPEPDEPFSTESSTAVDVEFATPASTIAVGDQVIGQDGIVTVDEVSLAEPGWIVVHADAGGPDGPVLGFRYLEAGDYEDVTIAIRWREGTPQLFAVIHEDSGESVVFDFPAEDQPALAGGEPIVAPFDVNYPPDLLVYDQPVVDGRVVVERVISNGPGWVAIHYDDNGQPGLIIGSAALDDGLNEQVEVELVEQAITPVLYARLHEDTQAGDDFDFPAADPPVLDDGRLPQAVPFRTNAGSHLIIGDQALGESGTVTAEVVVPAADAWLVIYSDEDGLPDSILGQTWVPAGLNRQVVVEIEDVDVPVTLHAMLHQDVDEPQEFEYPIGDDSPYYVLGSLVETPFQLTETTP